jgi:putative transposase
MLAKMHPTRGFDYYYGNIRNEGLVWNRKRVLRIYREIKLGLRRKHKRRLPARIKEPLQQPDTPNKSYSMDFISDALTNGRKLRVLKIMDDYTRESLAAYADYSICSAQVVKELEQIIADRGKPQQIRVDNGPEFTSKIFTTWCQNNEITIKYIQPGKPMQNGYIERLNRTFREDVLDAYQFETLEELRILSDEWQYNYNHFHPHKSLKRKTPTSIYNAWRQSHSERMIEQQLQQQGPATEHTIIHSL